MTTDRTRAVWLREYEALAEALAPYVMDSGDLLDPDAPAELVHAYRTLQRVGFACGWMA